MSNVWFCADLHVSHRMVAQLRGFDDPGAHDAALAENWDARVRPDDQVWVLGDISVGGKANEMRALEWIAQRPGVKHLVAGNHDSCLDAETRAVTKRGFVHADDLRPDDEILTVDDMFASAWVRPARIIRYPYEGQLIKMSNALFDCAVTPDHRVVGVRRRKYGFSDDWIEYRASELKTATLGVVVTGMGGHVDADIPDRDIRLAAWCHTDSCRRHRRWTFYQSERKRCRIEGLLAGEQIRVRRRDRHVNEICGKHLKADAQASYEFTVTDPDLNLRLDTLVQSKDSLGDWVWKLSERQVDLLIDEWVYTDGAEATSRKAGRGTAVALYCSREGLRHELMALMTANGWRVSENEYRPGHWRINACKSRIVGAHTSKTETVDYEGDVWCLTVPHGRFFIERSGKIMLTGNCHPFRSQAHKWQRIYLDAAFASVQQSAVRKIDGHRVLLSHFPFQGDPDGDHTPENRFEEWRIPPIGENADRWLLHGHTHSPEQVRGRQIHVGVDAHGLAPVPLEWVQRLIAEDPPS